MGTVILCSGAALFIGYQLGWVLGYERKEQDDKPIENEMKAIWKGDRKTWATR